MAKRVMCLLNSGHIDQVNEEIMERNLEIEEENDLQAKRLAAVEARQDNVEATIGFVAAAATIYAIAKKGPKLVSKVAELVGRKKKTDEFVDDIEYRTFSSSSEETETANSGFEDEFDENGDYREY